MTRPIMLKPLAILTILSSCTAAAFHLQEPKVLPSLDSSTGVGVTYIPMTDPNRLDPFTNYTQQRRVMISLYYPAQPSPPTNLLEQRPKADDWHHITPYMPPTTAALYDELVTPFGFPTNTFEQLSTLCQQNAPLQDDSMAHPLLIFSPGGGAPRFFYSTFLEDLARKGYVVAAIDHPHDALVVEFPDGQAVIGLNKSLTRDEVELLITVRAQDISFVLDELSRQSPSSAKIQINTTDVVAFGHSLGGGTIAEAALNDTRIKGGINVDGRMFGSMEKPNTTISKPILQFVSEASSADPYWRWDEEWARLSGWKLELVLNGAAHSTFSDMPLVAEVLDVRKKLGEDGKELLGKLDGIRGLEIVVEYVSAFAEFVLTGKKGSLLGNNGDERFPEVRVRRHT
ncbi:hypothetical protein HO173_005180 [Letharia columbiana]|uniref:1-alkyl-2-acetylglycerophosphocholine esterase n=1 Tax=Letharia columbiana TaxID=112416 RepID=A0A8H6L641_9LECA|nr:uncharacterized protein HO173_005180 [Letharia columbiana]KAF6236889.1 hypothetical protein HO173_005180 [Letharia columbiana]